MEGHLGVELFHRTTRRINLTDIGKDFYKLATRILFKFDCPPFSTYSNHYVCKPLLPQKNGHTAIFIRIKKSQVPCVYVYSLYRDFQHWDLTNRRGKTIKTKIQPILRANTGEFLNQAAIEGLGIIITPTFITYKDIEDGKLIPILPEYSLPQLNAYAIYPQTHHLSQRMKTFVSFLIERFKGGPYWDDFFKTIRINDES